MVPIVTIDGPSGSGKGTISKALAITLGWNYLDSGLIYRCYAFLHKLKVDNIVDELKQIKHDYSQDHEKIFYHQDDITKDIRGHEITKLSSELSQIDYVRNQLTEIQKISLLFLLNLLLDISSQENLGIVLMTYPDLQQLILAFFCRFFEFLSTDFSHRQFVITQKRVL